MKEPIHDKYLAFLDILGFKDLIENNELSYLKELYERIELGVMYSMAVSNIEHRLERKNDYKLPPIEKTHLNSLVISDSIVIWTDDASPRSFVEIISTVAAYLNHSMSEGLPLRGAISMGEIAIKAGTHSETNKLNSYTTVLGKALTKAYLLENKVNCAGCIIDDLCISYYQGHYEMAQEPKPVSIKMLEKLNLLKKYAIPLKAGDVTEHYTINWTQFMGNRRLNESEVRDAFSKHNKTCNKWEVEEKIVNTLNFLKDTSDDYELLTKMMKSRFADDEGKNVKVQ